MRSASPRLRDIAARVRRHYEQHGFPSSEVAVDAADTDEPDKVILTLDVKPGAPRLVAQRLFVVDAKSHAVVGNIAVGAASGSAARAANRHRPRSNTLPTCGTRARATS